MKTLYFIGGAVALVALIGAVGFAYLAWPEWSRTQRMRAEVKESTRTHDRPLNHRIDEDNPIEGAATQALATIRTRPGASDDVLSLVTMPSFHTWRAVSISLSPGAVVAQGRIIAIQHRGYGSPMNFSDAMSFTAPKAAFLHTARKLDELTDGWPGSPDDLCYDGTAVAFERIRPGKVTSGWGSVECDRHYAMVREIVFSFLRQYVPPAELVQPASEATWRP